tara:strand:+ start:1065 stop:1382 length:318 start_codon:yes stop_codon:yes gene_type:complete
LKLEQIINKIKDNTKLVGREIAYQALLLYYAYPKAPKKIKAVIASSLAYFILPLDAVPDPIPFLGFLDDGVVLASAMAIVRLYVTQEIKDQTNKTLDRFFPKKDS